MPFSAVVGVDLLLSGMRVIEGVSFGVGDG